MRGVLKHYKRYTALLAALEELSTRGPMSTLVDILAQLRAVGFHDPLTEAELRDALDHLAKWGFAEPFRDYAAPVRGYQGLTARQEAWALTRKGRGIVAAVRSAVVDAGRALQLPSRLLDSVEHTIRGMLRHLGHDDGLLPVDLDDTRTCIEEMQRVTADFYTALAQMVQSDVTDDGLFGENRDRVIGGAAAVPTRVRAGAAPGRGGAGGPAGGWAPSPGGSRRASCWPGRRPGRALLGG